MRVCTNDRQEIMLRRLRLSRTLRTTIWMIYAVWVARRFSRYLCLFWKFRCCHDLMKDYIHQGCWSLIQSLVIYFVLRAYCRVIIDELIVSGLLKALPIPERLPSCTEVNCHGNNIFEFIRGLRFEEIEYLGEFDQQGNKLAEYTQYSSTQVCGPTKGDDQPGLIEVHCHPGADDLPFSPGDLANLLKCKASMSIVVTKRYTYIWQDPKYEVFLRGLTPEILYRQVDKCYENKFYKVLTELEQSLELAFAEGTRISTVILCRPYLVYKLRKLAKYYGFRFYVRPAWQDEVDYFLLKCKSTNHQTSFFKVTH